MQKKSVVIVAGVFHKECVEEMIEAALRILQGAGISIAKIVRVPGAYDVPFAVEEVLFDSGIAGVVVLGAIEKGETKNGEIMGHVVNTALMNFQFEYRRPIGFGIIGPGANADQIRSRTIKQAEEAARAVIAALERSA